MSDPITRELRNRLQSAAMSRPFEIRSRRARIATAFVALAVLTYPGVQSPLAQAPRDIDPESRNRLPIVKRDALDEVGRALYDKTVDDFRTGRSLAGFQGPNGITLHSRGVAVPDQQKGDYLRFESRLGRRTYELAILVTARELDHQFEWAAHEPAALKAGVERDLIELVKHRRPIVGLAPKDASVIRLGREVFSERKVQPSTFADALNLFGATDLVDLVSVMGHYSAIAVLLNAFDQQLPPGQVPLLPAR
jgi:4-carboxymuconolactone decarboxylase